MACLTHLNIDHRLLDYRKLRELSVDKTLGPRGLCGFYYERAQNIVLDNTQSTNTFLHEFGHHLDYQFLHRWPSIGTPKDRLYTDDKKIESGRRGMIEEYQEGKSRALKFLGEDITKFKSDAPPLGGIVDAKVPSFYAIHDSREWFAESFMRYANPNHHDALKKLCPKTFAHIDNMVHGKYFKAEEPKQWGESQTKESGVKGMKWHHKKSRGWGPSGERSGKDTDDYRFEKAAVKIESDSHITKNDLSNPGLYVSSRPLGSLFMDMVLNGGAEESGLGPGLDKSDYVEYISNARSIVSSLSNSAESAIGKLTYGEASSLAAGLNGVDYNHQREYPDAERLVAAKIGSRKVAAELAKARNKFADLRDKKTGNMSSGNDTDVVPKEHHNFLTKSGWKRDSLGGPVYEKGPYDAHIDSDGSWKVFDTRMSRNNPDRMKKGKDLSSLKAHLGETKESGLRESYPRKQRAERRAAKRSAWGGGKHVDFGKFHHVEDRTKGDRTTSRWKSAHGHTVEFRRSHDGKRARVRQIIKHSNGKMSSFKAFSGSAQKAAKFLKGHYDINQPRDAHGRWTATGGAGKSGSKIKGPGYRPPQDGKIERAKGALVPAPENRAEWPDHIKKLVVPPAWHDVRISMDPDADLLVVGKDSKNRRQSKYNPKFVGTQTATKFARIKKLLDDKPEIESKLKPLLRSKSEDIRDHAAALNLIMKTGIRPGTTRETGAEKKSYGATTLLGKHVVKEGGEIHVKFTGKKGVLNDVVIRDPKLAADLHSRARDAGPKEPIFHNVNSGSLLGFLRENLGGKEYKTKDFRTLLGTAMAMKIIEKSEEPTDKKSYKKAVNKVVDQVASQLCNTRVIVLQSYIHPIAWAKWKEKIK
jgi:DNA topoisomerase-1